MTVELKMYSNMTRWMNGNQLHNNYGPTVEYVDCTKVWYQRGIRHRLDGPAVEYGDGEKGWWVDGVYYHTYIEYLIAVEQYNTNKETV